MNSSSSFVSYIRPMLLSQFVIRQSPENGVKGNSRSWLLAAAAILPLLFFASGAALAQTDPFVGTWQLNVAKSKFGRRRCAQK